MEGEEVEELQGANAWINEVEIKERMEEARKSAERLDGTRRKYSEKTGMKSLRKWFSEETDLSTES